MSSLIDSYFDTSRVNEEAVFKLQITPAQPSFGVLCQGFVYGLTVTVFNSGNKPERLRVFCTPAEGSLNQMTCTYEPVRLAPGMSTNINMKLEARHLTVSLATLRVVQASTQVSESWTIKATTVPIEVYQNVTKSLKMQGDNPNPNPNPNPYPNPNPNPNPNPHPNPTYNVHRQTNQ